MPSPARIPHHATAATRVARHFNRYTHAEHLRCGRAVGQLLDSTTPSQALFEQSCTNHRPLRIRLDSQYPIW